MAKAGKTKKRFKWIVEFEVDEIWVADGFDLTDQRAHDMLANDLRSALGHELKAKVLSAPKAIDVAKAQGYNTAEAVISERKRDRLPRRHP